VPKEIKLDILNIVEAAPVKKSKVIKMFDMFPSRYFRWQKKYYFDNCLEDQRGFNRQGLKRLEDLYKENIVDLRTKTRRENFVLGPERIMDALEEKGIYLSHETIRKILKNEGLIEPRLKVLRHEYQRFEAERPNALWQIDIMYLFIHGYGYLYLFSIMDDYSRKIMHWDLTVKVTSIDAVETLKKAMDTTQVTPESILTDRGIQFYTGDDNRYGNFEKFLKEKEIKHILARTHHPQTLGKIERYHRTLRQEKLNFFFFEDPLEARKVIREFVTFYNHERKHKGIGRVTPQDRYSGRDVQIKQRRAEIKNFIKQQRKFTLLSDTKLEQEVALMEMVQKISSKKEVLVVY
jgi:transposase InsO family protein